MYGRSQPRWRSGNRNGHGSHEVRRKPGQEQPPLAQRLAHEAQVEHLEVAQAAVDQLARAAGRARRDVARLHERDREPAGGRVQGDAGAGDAAADHEDVEHLRAHALERTGAGGGIERSPAHASA